MQTIDSDSHDISDIRRAPDGGIRRTEVKRRIIKYKIAWPQPARTEVKPCP